MLYALDKQEPRWETLIPAAGDRPAVEVLFPAAPSPKALRRARDAYRRTRASCLEAGADAIELLHECGDAFSREMLRWSILGWRGLGEIEPDPAGGEPIEKVLLPTQDRPVLEDGEPVLGDDQQPLVESGTISAFLADPRLFEAADEAFVIPWSRRDAEKNGFAPSSAGTSAGATPAADTAGKPATRRRKAGARSAPTSNTPRKRTKAKRSGS